MAEPPPKRRRISETRASGRPGPASFSRDISPPSRRSAPPPPPPPPRKTFSSPFRLTAIRDLSAESNVGAVSLRDLLGDPLIASCWDFNYLHDVDWLMTHFDQDTRSLVKVHVVHGFWKKDDPNRLVLHEQASQHQNVSLHTAYMPEMFGTHHTKMLILIRHDDTAQVIIHTANMISKDWTNMTNAVWQSPPLPIMKTSDPGQATDSVGGGSKFKADLLNYLKAYNTKRDVCKPLVTELSKYDFSTVRAAFIASVPGRHAVNDNPGVTRWGWAAMKHALRSVPVQDGKSEVVVQVSSIATLGGTDNWLQRTLFGSLSSFSPSSAPSSSGGSGGSSSSSKTSNDANSRPSFSVIFPTPDEIRRSLDGYASGGSIHTKIQSAQQAKQLQYLRPLLRHWDGGSSPSTGPSSPPAAATGSGSGRVSSSLGPRDGGRARAAPHIKTYIRYNAARTLDWALLTSANLSKQAWGEDMRPATRDMRIASWEAGVLVWPALVAGERGARMVATFKTDMPSTHADDDTKEEGGGVGGADAQDDGDGKSSRSLVGLRIPYNLPLRRYGPDEKPWVATEDYREPDWMGRSWGG